MEGPSVNGLRIVELLLGLLRRAGFSSHEAALLEPQLERSVLAFVMLETRAASAAESPDEQAARTRARRAQLLTLPPEEFPNVVEAGEYLCGAADADESFELALDLLIGGLEKLLESSAASADRNK